MIGPLTLALALHAQADMQNGFDISYHGKGQTISTPDGKLYYEKTGSGPVVIMIAGGPGGAHASFHGFFERLAKKYTLVMFDNVGRGRSDRLKNPKKYTVERDADDIERLRKHLGVDKIRLIGHSYGGMPAIAYSVKYGAHLERAVLSNTLHSGEAFQQNIDSCNFTAANQFPELWRQILALRKKGVKSSAKAYGELYGRCGADIYWYDADNESKMFHSRDPKDGGNGDVYLAMLGDDPEWVVKGTMKSFDPRRKLRSVKVPMLVCVGRYDRVATPKVAYELSRLYPHAILKVFEKSGHRPWVEETDSYFETVEAFLEGKH